GIDYALSHDQPRPIYHADRRLLQRYVQSDIVFHCRSPSLGGHIRLAPYVPGELIPLSLSGSIPELLHVAKVPKGAAANFPPKNETSDSRRSIGLQTRYQNRLSVSRLAMWSPKS